MKIFLPIFTLLSICFAETCTKNTFDNFLSHKTPYRVVANLNATEPKFKGCEAKKIWSVIRHGTRNPTASHIEKMLTRLPQIRDDIITNLPQATSQISNIDLDLFRKWTCKLTEKEAKRLTHEGEDEMLFLAERMHTRFPQILENVYSETSYNMKFTATQRAKKSAHYFSVGLFGKATAKEIEYPEPSTKDPILRFYKLCNKWQKEVKKNPGVLLEAKNFENSKYMKNTVREVNQRLGFRNNELDLGDIYLIYRTCAYETAWNKRKKSPWCSAFTVDNLKVFEYDEDLKTYWIDGYGHELTYKQACPAFDNMMEFFQSDEEFPRATLYFTHSGTILKMLAHFELYKDEDKLKAADYSLNQDRKWKTSKIDTFGANLAFVLYDCDGTKKVLTLHNENIVRLPSCPNSDMCDLSKVIKYYVESDEECAFDEMCDNNK